ncbi:serine O-acetyltransferase [Magnetococcus marinus MC-1]|uniref:Serine acetyltransferase n=1 Tax=Magnetococcus marinus (strain ATCC BAA-1437 / JCM 17883 / MC-1) TaxID=156889 RepID=A0LC63_MAGMM|nr:serine O-acetyltransferase [Magnetococcus marinus]ABK45556.1 serine O-acetyltransferase [Magnetococcus marinus MC-1]
MFKTIRDDIAVIFDRDPAARNVLEIVLCYPGVHAMIAYRFSHKLWQWNFKLAARFISHVGRVLTGIEIHPGAKIGKGFFIDHGMGVVIGETCEIGDNCTLYHGVTLGGTTWNKGKRHPTLKDGVVVGAGAKVLGPITLHEGARVGSNAVVVKDVPHDTTVVGIPGREVRAKKELSPDQAHAFPSYGVEGQMPDPVAKAVTCVLEQMHQMERRLHTLEEEKRALVAQETEQQPDKKRA